MEIRLQVSKSVKTVINISCVMVIRVQINKQCANAKTVTEDSFQHHLHTFNMFFKGRNQVNFGMSTK